MASSRLHCVPRGIIIIIIIKVITNGLRVDKVCTSDPVKLLFYWSDSVDPAVCRTKLKLLLPL